LSRTLRVRSRDVRFTPGCGAASMWYSSRESFARFWLLLLLLLLLPDDDETAAVAAAVGRPMVVRVVCRFSSRKVTPPVSSPSAPGVQLAYARSDSSSEEAPAETRHF
jgi:hypothetical protein